MNRRRKGRMAVVLPWLKRFGVVLGVVVFTVWVGAWLWVTGSFTRTGEFVENKTVELAGDLGFSVRNILVEGRVNTDPDLLRAIINTEKGDPLFAFDPADAKAMIEKIRWVKSARVERRLPDTIYIGLSERVPLALYQVDQALSLIDEEGTVITKERLSRFSDLIIVMGDDAAPQAGALLSDLRAEPVLIKQVKAAKRIGGRRWDLEFAGGVTVKLPEEDAGLALRRLAKAQEEDAILHKDIVNIDLRDPGRMIVRTKPGGVQEYQQKQEAAFRTGDNI